jgi:death-on-curing protein
MRLLSLGEVFALHRRILAQTGGAPGVRDLNAIASAVSQQRVSAGGVDAYPTIIEKAAALAYSLVGNHGFVDGNKRVGHAAMEVLLVLNGVELAASVDEQEQLMLSLAAGEVSRIKLVEWLTSNTVESRS